MLNPDGRLWIDRLSGGLEDTGCRVTRPMRSASCGWSRITGVEIHAQPAFSAELPETGERFDGLIPPVAAAPCFTIRRPAVAVFTLGDYVHEGIMSDQQGRIASGRGSRAQARSRRRRHFDRQDHGSSIR
jgi:Flp pilus assembly CpaF family ATPase